VGVGGFERSGGGFEHPRAVYFKGQQTGWEGAATRMAIVESLQEESAEEAGDFKRTLKREEWTLCWRGRRKAKEQPCTFELSGFKSF
jgi:hypothetical protein